MTETESATPGPDPSPIMALSTAYWGAQTLLTANRIGVFEAVAAGNVTIESIAAAVATQQRPTRLLLKACVALGLLEEGGDGYRNSPMSAAFLVPGRDSYLGDAIRYSDDLYATWGKLEQALREDRPPMAPENYLGQDPERTRHFVYGMHDRALGIGRALVTIVDLSGRQRLLDVGGGPGTYSALFARRYPGLRARVLDLPAVVAIAAEIVADMGAGDQVSTLPGDYCEIPFPAGNDVVLISGVFHRETETMCRGLITRARDSLEPGGLLIVADVFADAGGNGPAFATLFGLNMMLTAPNGGVHADADVVTWMRDAGLVDVETRPFPPPMPHRLVCGTRR